MITKITAFFTASSCTEGLKNIATFSTHRGLVPGPLDDTPIHR
jgi:hypothetical protein